MSQAIRVETLEPGDEVFVSPRSGFRVVSEVTTHRDGSVTVWYFRRGEVAYSKGVEHDPDRIVERCLVPRRKGDLVAARRGIPSAAALVRAEMLEQDAGRVAASERRARFSGRRSAA